MIRHGSIVPLIGGETIAQENVFGSRPDAIWSYSPFFGNDNQLLSYYDNEVPYVLIDRGESYDGYVDLVNSVCPCAGLSSLSRTSNADNPMNDWMIKTAEYTLGHLRPQVFWGENAPRLATKSGEPVVAKLLKIAKKNGYSMSLYRTKSLLHGLCQTRERTFYFFWKGDEVPLLGYFNRPYQTIEEFFDQFPDEIDDRDDMSRQHFSIVDDKPTDNPYYKYVLEEMGFGTHQNFMASIDQSTNPMKHILDHGPDILDVIEWMDDRGYKKQSKRLTTIHYKLKNGGGFMFHEIELPKDHIGAFVSHKSHRLVHPRVDRFISVREALSMMKMPEDFVLIDPKRNINHICQNVPVSTAMDMASEIKKYFAGELETVKASLVFQSNHKQSHEIRVS